MESDIARANRESGRLMQDRFELFKQMKEASLRAELWRDATPGERSATGEALMNMSFEGICEREVPYDKGPLRFPRVPMGKPEE